MSPEGAYVVAAPKADQVLSPRRYVVADGVPVAVRLAMVTVLAGRTGVAVNVLTPETVWLVSVVSMFVAVPAPIISQALPVHRLMTLTRTTRSCRGILRCRYPLRCRCQSRCRPFHRLH